MPYQLGLPIILREQGVLADGLLEHGIVGCTCRRSTWCAALATNSALSGCNQWGRPGFVSQGALNPDKPWVLTEAARLDQRTAVTDGFR